MSRPLVNEFNKTQIDSLIARSPQAIGIVGPKGSGKFNIAAHLAERLSMQVEPMNSEHILIVRPNEKGNISITESREIAKFLSLKSADKNQNRIVIIEDAHFMSTEAQNALLKTVEEMPINSSIIITLTDGGMVLPTIMSRLNSINISAPSLGEANNYFGDQYKQDDITRNYKISQGRAGLLYSLLNDGEHDLLNSINQAKQLLTKPSYERLCDVDSLSKTNIVNVLDALSIIARAAFVSAVNSNKNDRIAQFANMRKQIMLAQKNRYYLPSNKLLLTDLLLKI